MPPGANSLQDHFPSRAVAIPGCDVALAAKVVEQRRAISHLVCPALRTPSGPLPPASRPPFSTNRTQIPPLRSTNRTQTPSLSVQTRSRPPLNCLCAARTAALADARLPQPRPRARTPRPRARTPPLSRCRGPAAGLLRRVHALDPGGVCAARRGPCARRGRRARVRGLRDAGCRRARRAGWRARARAGGRGHGARRARARAGPVSGAGGVQYPPFPPVLSGHAASLPPY
jgi:hypothetical protein